MDSNPSARTEEDETHNQEYLASRKKYKEDLQAANHKTQEELDKTLITLSTVILGILLTVRQQIAIKYPDIGFPQLMQYSVAFFLIVIFAVLTSHFLSLWVNNSIISVLDKNYNSEREEEETKRVYAKSNYVRIANYLSPVLFFAGLLTAIFFGAAAANGTISGMGQKLEEGHVAPKPPQPAPKPFVIPNSSKPKGNTQPMPDTQKGKP